MGDQCTEQQFLKDVAEHQMTIVRDDGVHRHIRFAKPATSCMHFDLITWPGYLCYTGDMGTYVFRRLHDMFEFFRTDREHQHLKDGLTLAINQPYWGEKLEAVDKCDGYKEYSEKKFKLIINDLVDQHIEEENFPVAGVKAIELREAVHEEVLCNCETEQAAHEAARDFSHDGFEFRDFWESDLKEYSFRFTWCCYALAWGIQKYDEAKPQSEVPA